MTFGLDDVALSSATCRTILSNSFLVNVNNNVRIWKAEIKRDRFIVLQVSFEISYVKVNVFDVFGKV